jgi:excisionase family DNA binding protein
MNTIEQFTVLDKMENKPVRYNVEAVSAYLDFSILYIYKLCYKKKIPHIKIGKTILFDKVEIDAWMESKKIPVKEKPKDIEQKPKRKYTKRAKA